MAYPVGSHGFELAVQVDVLLGLVDVLVDELQDEVLDLGVDAPERSF